MKIVVVAESGFTRTSLNVNLRSAGYEVVEIEPTCLLDVLQVLRETLPHLVALDYEIPRCCCETTVRIIREDPILAMTPLLLLHQGREPEAMERMARWERVRFLQRPLQVEALLQAVRAIHPAISISS